LIVSSIGAARSELAFGQTQTETQAQTQAQTKTPEPASERSVDIRTKLAPPVPTRAGKQRAEKLEFVVPNMPGNVPGPRREPSTPTIPIAGTDSKFTSSASLQADEYEISGKFKKAAEVLKKLASQQLKNDAVQEQYLYALILTLWHDPTDSQSHVESGRLYQKRGDIDRATKEYRAVLALSSEADRLEAKTLLAKMGVAEAAVTNSNGDAAAPPVNYMRELDRIATHDVDFHPYMADLSRRLKRAWFPPKDERNKVVAVHFLVLRGGELALLSLDKSSGSAAADGAALEAVTKASPFRQLPAGSPAVVAIEFTFGWRY